jgi:HSP20 family protein
MLEGNLEKIILPESLDTGAPANLSSLLSAEERKAAWDEAGEDGELAVDVLETDENLIIIATMAGTKPEDIELHLHNDLLTIRGRRESPVPFATHYFNKECYWGKFSRTIVLPTDVKSELVRSEYKNGILAIHLPKIQTTESIPIMVIEE